MSLFYWCYCRATIFHTEYFTRMHDNNSLWTGFLHFSCCKMVGRIETTPIPEIIHQRGGGRRRKNIHTALLVSRLME